MDNKALILAIGTAAASILAALASSGEKALAALAGVPVLVSAWTSQMPMGVWSFLLALTVATLMWLWAVSRLPLLACGRRRHLSATGVAVLFSMAVVFSQLWAAPVRTPGAILTAFWIGLVAGLLGQYLGLLLQALFRKKAAPPPTT